MAEDKFQAVQRFRDFWTHLKSSSLKSPRSALYFVAWFGTLLILLFSAYFFKFVGLIQLLHIFVWFKLAVDIEKRFRPHPEFLLVLFFLIFLIESSLLRFVYVSALPPGAQMVFFSSLQVALLAALILLFSLLLIQNARTNFWFFAFTFVLVAILLNLIDNEGRFYPLIVQLVLFIFLVRKTAWLELLTKSECWMYLFVLIFALLAFSDINPFDAILANSYRANTVWYDLPKILYLGFKMYLLAVVIKIPVVLVYNFASLSRKLKIAGLFQSTFPQFIQLFMLVLIFFFFLAGWQADKVRKAMLSTFKEMAAGLNSENISITTIPTPLAGQTLRISGMEPAPLSNRLPDQGVIALRRAAPGANSDSSAEEFFIFFESHDDSNRRFLNFVKLDSLLLQTIAERTSILAGSLLQAYPYQPPIWESYLYEFIFFKDERKLWIFPFALIPSSPDWRVVAPVAESDSATADWMRTIDEEVLHHLRFNVGRVLAPLVNANLERAGFFAFDILLIPQASFFSAALLSYILFLFLVYVLINALVVGRMAKFGEEINRMIVQKFNQLKTGIREISSGHLDYKVKIEGRDEFVELAERFNTMGEKLKESIEEAREKERLQHELAIARQVQLELLPRTLPNIPGFQVAATLKTANEVGGDFYDLLPLDDGRFLFTIGDVSGKGTSAAFYMAQCISLIRFSPQFSRDPREIVLRLNHYFSDPLIHRQVFVTAVVGLLDAKNHKLQLVRAGHNPPILVPGNSAKEIAELKCYGLGIGLERNGGLFEKSLKPLSLKFQAGDTVVFYTDGFVEAASAANNGSAAGKETLDFYSEERLYSVLKKARGNRAERMLKLLETDIEQFYAGRPLVDDYTLLVIQRSG